MLLFISHGASNSGENGAIFSSAPPTTAVPIPPRTPTEHLKSVADRSRFNTSPLSGGSSDHNHSSPSPPIDRSRFSSMPLSIPREHQMQTQEQQPKHFQLPMDSLDGFSLGSQQFVPRFPQQEHILSRVNPLQFGSYMQKKEDSLESFLHNNPEIHLNILKRIAEEERQRNHNYAKKYIDETPSVINQTYGKVPQKPSIQTLEGKSPNADESNHHSPINSPVNSPSLSQPLPQIINCKQNPHVFPQTTHSIPPSSGRSHESGRHNNSEHSIASTRQRYSSHSPTQSFSSGQHQQNSQSTSLASPQRHSNANQADDVGDKWETTAGPSTTHQQRGKALAFAVAEPETETEKTIRGLQPASPMALNPPASLLQENQPPMVPPGFNRPQSHSPDSDPNGKKLNEFVDKMTPEQQLIMYQKLQEAIKQREAQTKGTLQFEQEDEQRTKAGNLQINEGEEKTHQSGSTNQLQEHANVSEADRKGKAKIIHLPQLPPRPMRIGGTIIIIRMFSMNCTFFAGTGFDKLIKLMNWIIGSNCTSFSC